MTDKLIAEPPPDSTAAYQPAAFETQRQAAWDERDAFAGPSSDDRADVHVHVGVCSLARPANLTEVRRHAIADSFARFRRVRGDAVLLSLGFEAGGLSDQAGAPPARLSAERVESAREQRREELQRLGLSFDWSRSFTAADPAADRWSQRMFLVLLEAGLVHRGEQPRDWCRNCRTLLPGTEGQAGQCRLCREPVERMPAGQWYMRLDSYVEERARLGELADETAAAGDGHDRLLGRVEGVELQAQAFDGTPLVVFTPFTEAIGEAKFVALSPDHPELERWMPEPEAKQRLAKLRAGHSDSGGQAVEYPTLMDSGLWVQVPGLDDLLPLIVSLAVDARFGATAVLGIPPTDPIDERLAERLPPPPTLHLHVQAHQSKARPAARFRARELPISSAERRGAAIPIVRCGSCGTVPIPLDAVPPSSPAASTCPTCGESAQGEESTLDPRVAAWAEMLIAMPPADRMEAGLEHPELRRWLPVTTTLHDADTATASLCSGALMKALRDLGTADFVPSGEPSVRDFLAGGIDANAPDAAGIAGDAVAPHALAEEVGADAIRFALLYCAAPAKSLSSGEFGSDLRLSENFLAHLWSYAEPRLSPGGPSGEAIDTSSRLHRRLAAWCDVALRKVTENFAELKMHRATRNVMILLDRIEDFERRAAQGGDPSAEDVDAVRSALLLLITLLAPIAPHLSDELWGRSGADGAIGEAPWPPRARRGEA
jgi:leucyl-tRNA synthetase